MKRYALMLTVAFLSAGLITDESFAQRGGRGGGGARPSVNRSPSMSRPSVSRPSTPSRPSVSRPSAGTRPSTPSRPSVSLPSAGTRPSTPSRPSVTLPSTGTRPSTPSRPSVGTRPATPGAGTRPSIDRDKLQNQIGTRPGQRPSMPDWFKPGESQLPATRPGSDRPTPPVAQLPAKPGVDRPTPPATQLPARPGGDRPTPPATQLPARPGVDRPTPPPTQLPAKPGTGNPPGRPPGTGKPPVSTLPVEGRPPGARPPVTRPRSTPAGYAPTGSRVRPHGRLWSVRRLPDGRHAPGIPGIRTTRPIAPDTGGVGPPPVPLPVGLCIAGPPRSTTATDRAARSITRTTWST